MRDTLPNDNAFDVLINDTEDNSIVKMITEKTFGISQVIKSIGSNLIFTDENKTNFTYTILTGVSSESAVISTEGYSSSFYSFN